MGESFTRSRGRTNARCRVRADDSFLGRERSQRKISDIFDSNSDTIDIFALLRRGGKRTIDNNCIQKRWVSPCVWQFTKNFVMHPPGNRHTNFLAIGDIKCIRQGTIMSLVPQRVSLIAQVAGILRQEISRDKWVGYLPGERSLANTLQISRSTLREALRVLQREGWLGVAHGQRTRILRTFKKRRAGTASRIVVALLSQRLSACSVSNLYQIAQLQHSLQEADLQLETYFDVRFRTQCSIKRLASIVQEYKSDCWVLFSMNRTVQHWFMTQQVPCLVDGFTYRGIALPSIDVDHAATCYHAAGKLLSAGHRRIVLLTSRTGFAGDLASEQAFTEAVHKSLHTDAVARIVYHDGTMKGVQNAIGSLLQSKERWTGFLVSEPMSALTAVSFLLRQGVRVPDDVAVISRGGADFLWQHVPSIASYTYDLGFYARKLSRLVIRLARTGLLRTHPIRILARFHAGDSYAPVRCKNSQAFSLKNKEVRADIESFRERSVIR